MTRTRGASSIAVTIVALATLAACGGGSPTASSTTVAQNATSTTVYTFGDVGSKGKVAALQHDTPTPVDGISGTVVEVASSNSDGYALTSTGAVYAWGAGRNGELGNGTRVRASQDAVRVDFPAGVTIKSLPNPMPFDGGLAIDSLGDVWGWGVNTGHELCLPGTEPFLRPTRLPLTDVTLATGAARHNLFYSHGTVYACGQGQSGQLGSGSFANASTPTRVVGLPAGTVKSLQSSWQGSGALMANGSYYNWGYNAAGQLGNGTTTNSAVPVQVNVPAPIAQVSQGGSNFNNGQTLALLANGSLWAWGNGSYGQLGNGSTQNSPVPVQIALPSGVRFAVVDSGGYSSYAIDGSGKLWSWGSNASGQLGTGSTSAETEARPVAVDLSLTLVSSTADNVVGLHRN
jgi:alpha-tubulin suppressor-like RCC1 family protein